MPAPGPSCPGVPPGPAVAAAAAGGGSTMPPATHWCRGSQLSRVASSAASSAPPFHTMCEGCTPLVSSTFTTCSSKCSTCRHAADGALEFRSLHNAYKHVDRLVVLNSATTQKDAASARGNEANSAPAPAALCSPLKDQPADCSNQSTPVLKATQLPATQHGALLQPSQAPPNYV